MIFQIDDNPFLLLENNGYHRYGIGDWSWIKYYKDKYRFHCIIDYTKETLHIHLDKFNNKDKLGNVKFEGSHKCIQKNEVILQEIENIRNSTFNGKLELLKLKMFKLCQIK